MTFSRALNLNLPFVRGAAVALTAAGAGTICLGGGWFLFIGTSSSESLCVKST